MVGRAKTKPVARSAMARSVDLEKGLKLFIVNGG